MKIKFNQLLPSLCQSLRRQFLLQIFFACVVVLILIMTSRQSFGVDNSVVQWRNSNDNIVTGYSPLSVSRDLQWRKPKTNSTLRNPQNVISLPDSESSILLVQHVESKVEPALNLPPQPSTIPPSTIPSTTVPPITIPSSTAIQTTPTSTPTPTPTLTPTPTATLPNMTPAKSTDIYEQEQFKSGIPKSTSNPPAGAVNTPLAQQQLKSNNSSGEKSATKSAAPADNLLLDKNIPVYDCNSIRIKPIKEISCDIKPRHGRLPDECPLSSEPYTGRHFSQTCFQWKASAVCTKGAYFENVQLERYGHSTCPVLEPIISGVKFFTTIPILPYKAGLTPPNECVYTLGHYRVGNCAPHQLDPLPISIRAILFESAAVIGAAAIIP
ncbi:MAG: hypothetical protein LBE18_06950 [Planctomycetaceae bacterium]|jgi:hypothetical protein|nr:hypothetical protein [Planctomycetaceae bacterium]